MWYVFQHLLSRSALQQFNCERGSQLHSVEAIAILELYVLLISLAHSQRISRESLDSYNYYYLLFSFMNYYLNTGRVLSSAPP